MNYLKIKRITIIAVCALAVMSACEETKRYEISEDDSTPPGIPVFIASKPLPGGARIYFQSPADEDILSVEASYRNVAGEIVRFAASYFSDSLDVIGFGSEGEHQITMYAVDRAGNRSKTISETVTALEPSVVTVAKSLQVLPSFASLIVKWEDPTETVYINVGLSYTQNSATQKYTRVFTSHQSEIQTIDSLKLYNSEPVTVQVTVKDKHGNTAAREDVVVTLLADSQLEKAGWSLPGAGFSLGGVTQADGSANDGTADEVIDGLSEGDGSYMNFYTTTESNPWNIIIDLGQEYELSRIVTHQRSSGTAQYGLQGNLYRGDNVLAYNMYVWNEAGQEWKFVSRNDIHAPTVKLDSEWKLWGEAGDKAFFYPDEPKFTEPTRYFRFEAINGKCISEITLYGKASQH